MNFDHEIIKDVICERDTSVKRENIIFENVYVYNGIIIWSNRFSLSVEEYELKLKQKERDNKINDLLC